MKNLALAMIIGSLVATPVLADTNSETDAVYKIRKSGDSGIKASPKSMGKAEVQNTEHDTDSIYQIRKSGTVKVVFTDTQGNEQVLHMESIGAGNDTEHGTDAVYKIRKSGKF
ncbi:MAG: hypothetical protein ABW146_07950 [Candidatus Sedimenticola sp. 6PFRAG7]